MNDGGMLNYGFSLAEVMRRSADSEGLPIQLALKIAQQLAHELHAACEARQRDVTAQTFDLRFVSPNVVFLGFDGTVRLTGFGVAPSIEKLATTDPSDSAGTLRYMAPEQLRGEPVDHRAELFGYGAILFEMLTNRPLFTGTPLEIRALVLEAPPPDLGEERVDSPPELVELLFELLCKEPAARPASAAEVSRRLSAILEARVVWEGDLDLSSFLIRLASDHELELYDAMDDAPTRKAPSSNLPTSPEHRALSPERRAASPERRVRRDVIMVALLLTLSAVLGWIARVVVP